MTARTSANPGVGRIDESRYMVFQVKASTTIYQGSMVVIDPALGSAYEVASSLQGHLRVVGVAAGSVAKGTTGPVTTDNAIAVSAGDVSVQVEHGKFTFVNHSGIDALAAADIGMPCYAVDNQTVGKGSLFGNRALAGIFLGLHTDGRAIVRVGGDDWNRFSGLVYVLKSNADLSALQFSQVKLTDDTGNAEVSGATGATDEVLGILLNAPASGDNAIVAVSGFAPCVVGSAGVTSGAAFNATTAGAQLTSAAAKHVTGLSLETGTSGQTKMTILRSGQIAA